MIDVESEIFDIVSKAVRAEYPKIYMVGEYINKPPSFPCVFFIESENQVYRKTRTFDSTENHIQVIYSVDVFSNLKTGKKSQCRAIMKVLDGEMERLGFTRTMMSPIPNEDDASIYRITARYRAIISKNKTIYRR